MKRFILELRRREVFRTAGLYVGISWILIEASSVLLPTFDAPEWIMRAIVIAIVIGFPIMLVLAWIYDVTGEGIKVQAEPTDTIVAPIGGRKMDFVVIGILSVALILSVYMNFTKAPVVLEPPKPVAVLIADWNNGTGDPLFDGSLEQALQIGVEVASFITTYLRSTAQEIAEEIRPGSVLDLPVSRLVAVRESIGMVLFGSILPDGGGYELAVSAIDPQGGEIIASVDADARDKGEILKAVGTLTGELLEKLGGVVLEEDIVFASDAFTAASLEAVKSYTIAQELQHLGQDEQAVEYYAKAVAQDSNFTRAYSGWALSLTYLGRTSEAAELWEKALANLDRVTERERLRTLGLYYSIVTRNYTKALESYQALVDKYPADDVGYNNLAVIHFLNLNFDSARVAGKKVLDLFPNSAMYQTNYALYAMYASEFEIANGEATRALESQPDYYKAWLPIATSALVAEDTLAAIQAYESMADSNELAATTAALGIADSQIYAGQFNAARETLLQSMDSGIASSNEYGTAAKYMALAHIHSSLGEFDTAVKAAEDGLAVSDGEPWLVSAALAYLAAGNTDAVAKTIEKLKQELQPQSRAYGLLIEGLVAHQQGDSIAAIEKLSEGIGLADLWLLRFYLGTVYLEAGHYAESLDEFTNCDERRGEAAAVFLDDLPTYRYVTDLHYWLGRAQQELGMIEASNTNLRHFVSLRPEGSVLAVDAAQRLP